MLAKLLAEVCVPNQYGKLCWKEIRKALKNAGCKIVPTGYEPYECEAGDPTYGSYYTAWYKHYVIIHPMGGVMRLDVDRRIQLGPIRETWEEVVAEYYECHS